MNSFRLERYVTGKEIVGQCKQYLPQMERHTIKINFFVIGPIHFLTMQLCSKSQTTVKASTQSCQLINIPAAEARRLPSLRRSYTEKNLPEGSTQGTFRGFNLDNQVIMMSFYCFLTKCPCILYRDGKLLPRIL